MLLSTGGSLDPLSARATVALAAVLLLAAFVAPAEEQELQRLGGYGELVSYLASHPDLRVPPACADMVSERTGDADEGAVPGQPHEAERRCATVLRSLNRTGWRVAAFVPSRGALQLGTVSFSLVHRRMGTAILHALLLLLLGPLLERHWGSRWLLAVYVGGAAVVAIVVSLAAPEDPAPMAGAQVPLSAFVGALLLLYGKKPLKLETLALHPDGTVDVPGWTPALLWALGVAFVAWRGDASAGTLLANGLALLVGAAAGASVPEAGAERAEAGKMSPARQAREALQALVQSEGRQPEADASPRRRSSASRVAPTGTPRRRSSLDAGFAPRPHGHEPATSAAAGASQAGAEQPGTAAEPQGGAWASLRRADATSQPERGPVAPLGAAVLGGTEGVADGSDGDPNGGPTSDREGIAEDRSPGAQGASASALPPLSVPVFQGRSPLAEALPGVADVDLSVAMPTLAAAVASGQSDEGRAVSADPGSATRQRDAAPGPEAEHAARHDVATADHSRRRERGPQDTDTFDPLADLDFAPATRPDAFRNEATPGARGEAAPASEPVPLTAEHAPDPGSPAAQPNAAVASAVAADTAPDEVAPSDPDDAVLALLDAVSAAPDAAADAARTSAVAAQTDLPAEGERRGEAEPPTREPAALAPAPSAATDPSLPADLGVAPLQSGGRTTAYGSDEVAHARRLIDAQRARLKQPDAAPTVTLAHAAPREASVSRAVASGFAVRFADGSEGVLRHDAIRAVAVGQTTQSGPLAVVLVERSERRELWRLPMHKTNLALLVGPGLPADAAWRQFVTQLAANERTVRLPRAAHWPAQPAPEFANPGALEALVLSQMRAG